MMINVRYVTPDNSIVAWITDTGAECSAMTTAAEVCEYLSSGGTIAPYTPPVINPKEQAKDELAATDKDLARIAEDLIGLLISKGVIAASDLPQPVRDKLDNRKELRSKLGL